MANSTEHGFVTPDYSDPAAVPAAIAVNNQALETVLSAIDADLDELKKNKTIIVFHDWDDTVIGIGIFDAEGDIREAVNNFVKTNMIHPDLRNQTAAQRASTERADNYRGEYPYTGPDPEDPLATGGENTVENGGDYPLTNHLEYCFYGKDIDSDYPFVSGWAVVSEDTMEDTFTALSANQTPEAAGLTMADFGNFAGGGLNPTIVRIKAVYEAGTDINRGVGSNYEARVVDIQPAIDTSKNIFELRRINSNGYGAGYAKNPTLVAYTRDFKDRTENRVAESRGNKKDVSLFVAYIGSSVASYDYTFYNAAGDAFPAQYGVITSTGNIHLYAADGVIFHYYADDVMDRIYDLVQTTGDVASSTILGRVDYICMRLSSTTGGGAFTAAAKVRRRGQAAIWSCMSECMSAGGDYKNLTWYQLQYAVLQTEAPYYVANDTAEAYCKQYDALMSVLEGG